MIVLLQHRQPFAIMLIFSQNESTLNWSIKIDSISTFNAYVSHICFIWLFWLGISGDFCALTLDSLAPQLTHARALVQRLTATEAGFFQQNLLQIPSDFNDFNDLWFCWQAWVDFVDELIMNWWRESFHTSQQSSCEMLAGCGADDALSSRGASYGRQLESLTPVKLL